MSSVNFPELPDFIENQHGVQPESDLTVAPLIPIRFRSLIYGCYLLNYKPVNAPFYLTYDGTLRVEDSAGGRSASGDLYSRPYSFVPHFPLPGFPVLGSPPNPAGGIPIFATKRYRYYLRVTSILEGFTVSGSFTLGLDMRRYTPPASGTGAGTWTTEAPVTAQMFWTTAPAGYPSPSQYLKGEVKNAAGTVMGSLTMGWVSKYLRRATVEIDTVAGSESPLNNGAGVSWTSAFAEVGWEITVTDSDHNVVQPSGASWSDAEMHAAMLARRSVSSLDKEWRYHVLAVKNIDSTPRGIMYDSGATDSNKVSREGIGISTHWMIPNTAEWGLSAGQRFGAAKKPFFRTAIHEIGHAMGLYHNTVDLGFMNTTDVIAASATSANPFPNNIKWSFAGNDQRSLRHYPDIYVRPGGTAFGSASPSSPPLSPLDSEVEAAGLTLTVTPLLTALPIGAPARVHLKLTNESGFTMTLPADLSLKSGVVSGKVIDSAGNVRTFKPLILFVDDHDHADVEPGGSIESDLTLLRGAEGSLFPAPGFYQIMVDVALEGDGYTQFVSGSGNIMVTAATTESHANAALKVLTTPDILLTLAIGGDHIEEGIEAVQVALEDEVLRPHYAYIEAKRQGQRFNAREANADAVADLITNDTVMSPSEEAKANRIAGETENSHGHGNNGVLDHQ